MTDDEDDRSTKHDAHGLGPACWSCSDRIPIDRIRRDGILRARREDEGGPYRILSCPSCSKANLCERTPRGRWFASPPFRPSLLDWLVGRFFAAPAEDFLRAAAWFEANEERRRYFFERDGDHRYSGPRVLSWLRGRPTPPARPIPEAGAERDDDGGASDARDEKDRRSGRDSTGSESGARGDRGAGSRERPRAGTSRQFYSPHAILGISEDASDEDIRRAFHRLAKQYHPDKVHHLGEEFERMATEKFKELQKAFEELRRRE
jgi:hypothetical protein